jgi:hypothetical protein
MLTPISCGPSARINPMTSVPFGTDLADFTNMFLLGALIVASASLLVTLNGLRKAPEAYEDELGFHVIRERPRCSGASILPRRSKKPEANDGRLDLPLPVGVGHFKG